MKEQELKTIIFQLLKKIAPETEPEKLKEEDNIRDVLDIDSFDFLQFIVGLDEKLGIKTPEADYGKVTTLRSLVNYIELIKS